MRPELFEEETGLSLDYVIETALSNNPVVLRIKMDAKIVAKAQQLAYDLLLAMF